MGVKVLILHQHFKVPWHGGAIRSYYLARALARAGHKVVVLSGHNGDYRRETIDGIDVHWLPVRYDNRFAFPDRTRSFLRYIYLVIRRSQLYAGADICYAISVPLTTGLAALWIRRTHRIPYIFEVGDLWPDAPIALGFIKSQWLKGFLYGLEKKIYNRARAIVALSPPIKSAIEGRINNKTVHLIPNMSDTCFYYPSERDLQVEQEFQVQGRFVVTYAGALGYANGLDYLLRCAGVCQAGQLPVSFLIFGDGAEGAGLQRTAMQLGLRNIAFLPFQDRVGVRKIFSITDAVFVCYRPVAILETGSPNKYFDGLSAGKLIVVNFSGWIREEIERESCGIYVDPINAGSFVDGIGPFMNDKPLLKRYQNNSRRLAEQKYSRNELSKKFVEVISGSRQGHLLSTS